MGLNWASGGAGFIRASGGLGLSWASGMAGLRWVNGGVWLVWASGMGELGWVSGGVGLVWASGGIRLGWVELILWMSRYLRLKSRMRFSSQGVNHILLLGDIFLNIIVNFCLIAFNVVVDCFNSLHK